jgi:hypothetical protein
MEELALPYCPEWHRRISCSLTVVEVEDSAEAQATVVRPISIPSPVRKASLIFV